MGRSYKFVESNSNTILHTDQPFHLLNVIIDYYLILFILSPKYPASLTTIAS